MVDVEIAAVTDVNNLRPYFVYAAFNDANDLDKWNCIATIFGKSGKARRLSAEYPRCGDGIYAAHCIAPRAISEQHQCMNRISRVGMACHCATAPQSFIKPMRRDDQYCLGHPRILNHRRTC